MKITANYLRQISDTDYPINGIAVVSGQSFKTSDEVLIDAPHCRTLFLTRIALISAAISAVSNGATVAITERDLSAKTAAVLSTAMTGANNDIVLTARTKGIIGNSITLALIDPAANSHALSVAVVGSAISVTLATDSDGVITTTATQLLAAIAGNTSANALVSGALKGSDTGAGVVTALSVTPLSGGLEYVVVQTLVDSVDLADVDAVGLSQLLTIKTGAAPVQYPNKIGIAITAGTATEDVKDIILEGVIR